MKYPFLIIALLAALITTSSAHNEQVFNTAVGDLAPIIKVENSDNPEHTLDLRNYRGEYVLITFWQSTDASSRRDCNTYNSWINSSEEKPENLRFIAINFDKNKDLYNEIARRDNLNTEMQYNVQGTDAQKIIDDYRLDDTLGSILIAPDGRILAKNPSIATLASI